MNKPKIFIGSSSEGKQYANTIQLLLSDNYEPTTWEQGVFSLSKGYLEELETALDKYDFAILVLTPDDMVVSRDKESQSPRDNVIFEIGLFIGRIGRNRTFIVFDKKENLKIPSDLSGISYATFELHSDKNLQASLGAACTKIKTEIDKHGVIQKPFFDFEQIQSISGEYYKSFIGNIISIFSKVDKVENPLFKEYVRVDCDDFIISADKWGKATLMIPQANYDGFLIDAYESAKTSVFSTSIKEYLGIWTEPFGERLLEAHKESDAKVTRVFVFDTRNDISDDFINIMKIQENSGIEVKIFIDKEYKGFNFPTDLSKDFTVIDEGKIIGKTVTFGRNRNAEWVFDNLTESNRFNRYIERLLRGSRTIEEITNGNNGYK